MRRRQRPFPPLLPAVISGRQQKIPFKKIPPPPPRRRWEALFLKAALFPISTIPHSARQILRPNLSSPAAAKREMTAATPSQHPNRLLCTSTTTMLAEEGGKGDKTGIFVPSPSPLAYEREKKNLSMAYLHPIYKALSTWLDTIVLAPSEAATGTHNSTFILFSLPLLASATTLLTATEHVRTDARAL